MAKKLVAHFQLFKSQEWAWGDNVQHWDRPGDKPTRNELGTRLLKNYGDENLYPDLLKAQLLHGVF